RLAIAYRAPEHSIDTVAVMNEEPIRMVSAAVQQESEGAPVLISNAKEVETRLGASESTSSVGPQRAHRASRITVRAKASVRRTHLVRPARF
ncbi:MAG TPA: hypothetical protein VN957_13740, partial [Chthoniobacterales bacterium]|nr:hypothetical protein [Chthoniobacterales bacterium]